MRRHFIILVLIVMGAGCVESPDYAELWVAGSVDQRLVGTWHGTDALEANDVTISIVSNAYEVYVTTTDKKMSSSYRYSFVARTVPVAEQTFLLCRDLSTAILKVIATTNFGDRVAPPSADLMRYSLTGDGFVVHFLDCPKVQKLIDEGSIEGMKTPPRNSQGRRDFQITQVKRFDKKTIRSLISVFCQSNAWHSAITFKKDTREQGAAPASAGPSSGER
jgi:hypothetical protein